MHQHYLCAGFFGARARGRTVDLPGTIQKGYLVLGGVCGDLCNVSFTAGDSAAHVDNRADLQVFPVHIHLLWELFAISREGIGLF
jgi:hypothetical protein